MRSAQRIGCDLRRASVVYALGACVDTLMSDPDEIGKGPSALPQTLAGVNSVRWMEGETVTCPYCDERIFVLAHPKPATRQERAEADGTRSFVLVSGDGWLLHRCVIRDD